MGTLRRLHFLVLLTAAPGLLCGQTLTGSVVAAETGAPLEGAIVLAIKTPPSASQPPTIQKATADASGRFSFTLSPGQYQFCAHHSALYLDPCQWGGTTARLVAAGALLPVTLRLQKGGQLIVRTYDSQRLLRSVEKLHRKGMSVVLTGASIRTVPIPVVYDSGRVRDYGTVVPLNTPLRVVINSADVKITDSASSDRSSGQGITVQVAPTDLPAKGLFPGRWRSLSGASPVKLLSLYATGRK